MSNAQTLEDLRYCADNFTSHKTEVENNLREFAAHLIGAGISSPAQKPASELGGSGAGLVGTLSLFRAGVSVLFARSDSCYFDLVADIWDIQRDARGYLGPNPVVAHPPCRGWGRLSHLAKPRSDEKALGLFAVDCVRTFGGVLEHPWASKLWKAASLPLPGFVDSWGGYTILVDQGWFGHQAPKPTWLYICGVDKSDLPQIPVQLHRAEGRTLELSPADRERTPPDFARFLVEIAGVCNTPAVTSTLATSNSAPVTRTGRRGSYLDLADCLIG